MLTAACRTHMRPRASSSSRTPLDAAQQQQAQLVTATNARLRRRRAGQQRATHSLSEPAAARRRPLVPARETPGIRRPGRRRRSNRTGIGPTWCVVPATVFLPVWCPARLRICAHAHAQGRDTLPVCHWPDGSVQRKCKVVAFLFKYTVITLWMRCLHTSTSTVA